MKPTSGASGFPACRFDLPAGLARDLETALEGAIRERWIERLHARDASLWTGGDEARWLGWLDVAERERPRIGELETFARSVAADGLRSVLLLGMGGSSLGPEVLETVFGAAAGALRLRVLDSTDPAQLLRLERATDLATTLILVASKSGSTLEPNVLFEHFWERLTVRFGDGAGRRVAAITDPGSALEALARRRGLRAIFHGEPQVGGRYSVLSRFGLVPAALLGVDLAGFLDRSLAMARACGPDAAPETHPALRLGLLLGVAARGGRDKLTLHASPALASLGAWLEQLIAESTGKDGRAVLPIDGEALAESAGGGGDRLFVHLRLAGDESPAAERGMDALAAAGHPVVRLEVAHRVDLGAEFYRWEVATAIAGAVLGIHPFDQPDVEASKVASRRMTDAFEATGALPAERPFAETAGLRWYAESAAPAWLAGATGGAAILARHLERAGPGDYIGVLAWLDRNEEHAGLLARLRRRIGARTGLPVALGFGPRFLHSTGQAYKGGPNRGVFLQIGADDAEDVPIPGRRATFGAVKAAQARGDFEVLLARRRRALRVELGADARAGLERLLDWLDR